MSKADRLGAGASFGQARPVSARRAAIGAATAAPTLGVPDPTELSVALISHNPDNPRDHLRDLDGMTQSITELGVINAITVASVSAYLRERPERADDLDEGAKYIVVDGHRRLEGARRAGLTSINVHVDDARVATDESLLESAFVANVHRDNMTDLEQAQALESLVKFYGSQTKASQRLGISQATISSKLSLLKLSPDLQAELASGERNVEHVRNLGKLSPQEQREAADARAHAARQRAERKRAASTPATASSQEGSDYHGVIGDGAASPTAAPPTSPKPATASKPVPTAGSVPVQAEERPLPAAKPGKPEAASDTADVVPWHDVQAVAQLIRSQMTSADRIELTILLQKQNLTDLHVHA
ncbi:ParB/RepB/Spo0J family partition protein [Streptomyces sp. SAJ15]|uniref:ParB/RepB/Spo0J family partition protein n=1 Tax=Streptomyces sp. SAJ15 TaxID=2011095 RepID=UPI001186B44A|nr:ParB/RepB/Spo0J family partition protein [Streptomyces sp. SAJ15]TVL88446.1 chromosome partitioning protein ParB [Streptomyces sp. SAJ15]